MENLKIQYTNYNKNVKITPWEVIFSRRLFMFKKKYCFLLAAAMILLFGCSDKNIEQETVNNDIMILYTANVNCEGDSGMTYAGVAAYKSEMEQTNKYVTLVDAGNYLSGQILGTLSGGSYAAQIMNSAGYDIAALGKKDFYYGIDKISSLISSMKFDIISCNFIKKSTGESVFSSYQMKTYGDKKVAFIGISNPSVLNKRTESKYTDDNGEVGYDFCRNEDGTSLYNKVQETVDDARKDGADYVVALSSLGENHYNEKWDIEQLVANTTGVDAVIDGGSENVIAGKNIKNKDGEDVVLTEPGSQLEQIGKMCITNGKITTELVSDYKKKDKRTSEYMTEIIHKYQASAKNVVVNMAYNLVMKSEDGSDYLIRHAETNLGDLCADAYRDVLGADIALVDAGSIGEGITDNNITYDDMEQIFPYNQQACLIKATGKMIRNALELASTDCPYANRNFLQVSGLKYSINTKKASAIIRVGSKIENVSEDYRVSGIQVLNSDTNEYEALDLDKEYLVAMSNYMYKGLSGNFYMFKDCEPVLDDEMSDAQLLLTYLEPFWGDNLPKQYENPEGDGRISVLQ